MQKRDPTHPDGSPPSVATVLALAALSERLDAMHDLEEASLAVAEFAIEHLSSDLAGLWTQQPQGRPTRLAASSRLLTELDEIEAQLQQGPGTAWPEDGAVITVADTRTDRLWPAWSSAAAARDVLSVRLIGMPRVRRRPVTLQLLSSRADAYPPDDLVATAIVAKHAGLALRHLDRLANLEDAIATRDLIGQAQGIVMERYSLTSEQAMHFLRRSSQHSQEKVRWIAEQLVSSRMTARRLRSRSAGSELLDPEPAPDPKG
jgi:hypothetical protein